MCQETLGPAGRFLAFDNDACVVLIEAACPGCGPGPRQVDIGRWAVSQKKRQGGRRLVLGHHTWLSCTKP